MKRKDCLRAVYVSDVAWSSPGQGGGGDSLEAVGVEVGGVGLAVVLAEAVIDGDGEHAGVAGGLDVHARVAANSGFVRLRPEFFQNGERPGGVGILFFKTVAAIDGAE